MAAQNGYFRLNIKSNGVYLVSIPPEGGEPLQFSEVDDYLAAKKIDYNKKVVLDTINSLEKSVEILIASGKFMPENEMLKIEIDFNRRKAVGRFYPPSNQGNRMTREEIVNDMIHAGIKYGLQEEALDSFLESPSYCKDYILAVALDPVEGSDASIQYFFNTDLTMKPKTNDDGSVDFHQLDNICHVSKGELLAQLTPAIQGKPGIDVCGIVIRPQKVTNKILKFGRNISASEDRTKIYSDVDGHVSLVDDQVFVSDIYEVPADVDSSTGDISYDGNVAIKGNVRTGFTVRAKGDIIVNGVVEGAVLEAGGQIILKRGISGKNRGRLFAGSNIVSKFIESAEVTAGGYISTDAIMHSHVSARGDIIASGKKGFISGGELRSTTMICAKTAGSTMGTTTVLEVGTDPNILEEYRGMEKEIAELQSEIEKINQNVMVYARRLKNGEKLSLDKVQYLKNATAEKKIKEEKLASLNQKYKKVGAELEENKSGCIKIQDTIYPGCKVIISSVITFIRKPLKHCRLVKGGADIRMQTY